MLREGNSNGYSDPSSSRNPQGGLEGVHAKDECRKESVEAEGGEEGQSDSGSGVDLGEGVPLTKLSKPRNRAREGKNKGADGWHTEGEGEEGESVVVRWSQDGGSPTSFRRLKKQHMSKSRQKSSKKRRRPRTEGGGVDSDEESMGEVREGWKRRGKRKVLGVYWTPDEEAKVVRKMDKWLVGFLAGLYMLSFLDRSSTCA